jgi:hypothetical protein
MEYQFDCDSLYAIPIKEKQYYCSPKIKAKNFTISMKHILLKKKYPELKLNLSDINEANSLGINTLMITCMNYNT